MPQVEISDVNIPLLDRLAEIMQQRRPDLWGDHRPTYNAVIGYAVAHALGEAPEEKE